MLPTWLKENVFIVAALALPLLVAGLFLVVSAVPRLLVDDPRYDLLFAITDSGAPDSDVALSFRLEDGGVWADASASARYVSGRQQLYRFDAATMKVRRIDVNIPEGVRQTLSRIATRNLTQSSQDPSVPPAPLVYPVPFRVSETAGLSLIESTVAPDGYEFADHAGDRGLFGELFGMGSSRFSVRIVKHGRIIALQIPDRHTGRYYYANAMLLGWVEQ